MIVRVKSPSTLVAVSKSICNVIMAKGNPPALFDSMCSDVTFTIGHKAVQDRINSTLAGWIRLG